MPALAAVRTLSVNEAPAVEREWGFRPRQGETPVRTNGVPTDPSDPTSVQEDAEAGTQRTIGTQRCKTFLILIWT